MERLNKDSRSWMMFVGVVALFLVAYMVARGLLETVTTPAVRVAAALLPIPPFILWLILMVRGARELDELQRRIQLEALAFAFPLTLILLLTLGLLEIAIELNPDDWSYRHVWAMLPLFYFMGLALAKRRYE
jgi:hypothetical protein